MKTLWILALGLVGVAVLRSAIKRGSEQPVVLPPATPQTGTPGQPIPPNVASTWFPSF